MIQHFPRNTTVPIPIDVPLFDGINTLTGQASNLTLRIIALENGYTLDNADGQFRTGAAQPTRTVAAFTDYGYDYSALVSQTNNWPRGHYRGVVRHSASGREFDFDFTVGLFVPRQLGYSAIYDGQKLNLSVWVEELGVAQTDYAALNNCQILNSQGAVITGGTLGNNSSPSSNGVFNFNPTVNLAANTNYIFTCDASVAGPATRSNYTFTLRVGLARP